MESKLTKKITKRILITIVILNIILTLIIAYSIISNYNRNIINNMSNINISSSFIMTSINDKDNVLGVINNIKSSYEVDAYVLDKNGDSIIGDAINVNIKREKDVDYKSNIVIKVNNGFNSSKGITISEMSLNNKYFGELVLVKDFTDEYVNTIFTLLGIIFSQVVVIGILLKLISNYIRKSLEPLSVLKEGIVKYGKGEDVINLNIRTNDEIEDLSVSFINMAEEVNNEKRKSVEFFNNATHELKTPITAISGYVQALTKKPIEEINLEFRNRAFYRMKIESSKLLILVENLLDISRGAVKKESLIEEINISNITKECI
ncbi:MAG: histidine kinase dimerization/phospho-acceptor domain-containing protein, partial [Clostridium sp.]